MRWYRSLYSGPLTKGHEEEIRKKAEEGKWMAGVYYITLSSSEKNLLDIFHNGMLKQKLFVQNQRMDVVGVAGGKREAMWLTKEIIKDVYDRTGSIDVRSYFKMQDFVED